MFNAAVLSSVPAVISIGNISSVPAVISIGNISSVPAVTSIGNISSVLAVISISNISSVPAVTSIGSIYQCCLRGLGVALCGSLCSSKLRCHLEPPFMKGSLG